MFEGVSCQGCVVYLDVYLEVFLQAVCLQETDNRFSVHIILMLGRFHRFRLDQERTGEAFGTGIVTSHGQHLSEVLFFTFLVCVKDAHVTFTATPEHIVGTTQLNGSVNCIFDLNASAGYNVKFRVGSSTVHVACVTEYVGCPPQQLDAGFSLFLLGISHDFLQVSLIFFDGIGLFAQVDVVEAVVLDTQLLHEFKTGIHLVLGSLNLVGVTVPGELLRTTTELVTTFSAQGVPPCHCKLQPVFHLLTHDYLFSIIIVVSHRVLTIFSFEFDFSYSRKILFCCHKSFVFKGQLICCVL